jgi:hypothetical protein
MISNTPHRGTHIPNCHNLSLLSKTRPNLAILPATEDLIFQTIQKQIAFGCAQHLLLKPRLTLGHDCTRLASLSEILSFDRRVESICQPQGPNLDSQRRKN